MALPLSEPHGVFHAAKAHFLPITPRDAAMAETLNDSYLAQLFIRPNAGAVDGTVVMQQMGLWFPAPEQR